MRNSIRTRLTVAFIGLAIGPLLLVGVILARQSFTIQAQQALDLQREVARHVAAEVTTFFEELENELRLISKMQVLSELDRNEEHSILKLLISQDVFERLILLDNQGQAQIHLSRLGLSATDQGYFAEADEFVIPQTTGEVYYSPVWFEETTGEPLMTIAVPLLDVRTGLVDGVLVSEVRLKKIWNLIADVRVSPGQSVYIVDAQDKVVAHRNPSVVLRDTHFDIPEHDGIQPGLAGSRVVLAVNTVHFGEQEFNIIAEQAVPEALALAINSMYVITAIVVIALVVASSLGFLIVRQIVWPIQTMAATAQAVSTGDLSQQVQVTSRDELGVLADAFNDMTGQLRAIINDLEQQIAERKRAEESLSEANETLQALFDYSPLAIIVIDLDSHILFWNKAAEKMYGWTAQEVLRKFLPSISEEKLEEHQAIRDRVINGESITNLEVERQRKDGSTFFLEAAIAPLRDATGKVYAQVSIGADITERKQAEEALRKKTEELDQFFTVSLDLLCIADTEGYFRRLNPQWEVLLGYSLPELEGQRFLDLVHPDDQTSTLAALGELGDQKVVLGFVNRYRCKDGSYRWIEWRSCPAGRLVYAAAHDITERKRAEAALRESEFFLRKSQAVARIGSYYFDARTEKWISSPALDEIFGIDDSYPKDVEGWIALIHPEDKDEMRQYFSQSVLAEHNRFDKEYRIIRYDDQQECWIHGLGELEFDESGNAIKMIGTLQDITERKQAEEKIRQLNAELEQRVSERTAQLEAAQVELLRQERLATLGKLTATVSHEIRNPLATIRASAFTLDRKTRDKGLGVERVLDRIERNITRCDNIIGELLDYTRMPDLNLTSVLFDDWLNRVLDEQTLPEGITLSRKLNVGVEISLDPGRFRRVIINLFDNACQAMLEYNESSNNTPPLVLSIQSERVNRQLKISISDTGPGIPPDVMPHIFEPLYSTKGFGVGLGLPIVKEIIKQHAGKIEITSELGQGTQVILWLPLLRQERGTD